MEDGDEEAFHSDSFKEKNRRTSVRNSVSQKLRMNEEEAAEAAAAAKLNIKGKGGV